MRILTELSYKAISNISPSTFGPALLMTLLDLAYFSHVSREQITKYLEKKKTAPFVGSFSIDDPTNHVHCA